MVYFLERWENVVGSKKYDALTGFFYPVRAVGFGGIQKPSGLQAG